MKHAMSDTLDRLFDYLGDDRWDLGEILVDLCEGAEIINLVTRGYLTQLIQAMPEPDNFTAQELAQEIRKVGTPYAVATAQDMITILD